MPSVRPMSTMMLLPFSNRRTMPRDELALAILVLVEDEVALGVADALQQDLLRRLRGDAAEGRAAVLELQDVAVLLVLLARLLRVLGAPEDLEAELLAQGRVQAFSLSTSSMEISRSGVGHGLDHGHVLEEVDLPGVLVEARLELAGRAEDALRGLQDRGLDRLDEDLLVDPLLLRDLIEDAAEARLRGRHRCHRCHDVPVS